MCGQIEWVVTLTKHLDSDSFDILVTQQGHDEVAVPIVDFGGLPASAPPVAWLLGGINQMSDAPWHEQTLF